MKDYDDWAADRRLGRNAPSAPVDEVDEYEGDVIDEITEAVKRVEDKHNA